VVCRAFLARPRQDPTCMSGQHPGDFKEKCLMRVESLHARWSRIMAPGLSTLLIAQSILISNFERHVSRRLSLATHSTHRLIPSIATVKASLATMASRTPTPDSMGSRDRLPNLFEVLSRRTTAPVDLFSFYIYMRDVQRSVDYLDFWYAQDICAARTRA
jgi:hypothetical protein